MSPFDFVKSINYQKTDLLAEDPDNLLEKEYVPFIINRALSNTPDTLMEANEMNIRPFLDHKLQYHYLLNIVRKKNRFGKWNKFEITDKIKVIQKYYGYNVKKAKEVESLFSDYDIEMLRTKMDEGGLKE